jgi:hypothetical protein
MPLHLLQKKSWHVYNTENVERVRRDEAEAQAREDAADQRTLEEDAERRMKLLRGERVPSLKEAVSVKDEHENSNGRSQRQRDDALADRKRRRLRGEDDTDRDIRVAREQDLRDADQAKSYTFLDERGRDAPLKDSAGHIQLIPAPEDRQRRLSKQDNPSESDKARKRDEGDVQPMRFSNAAGYDRGSQRPWYTTRVEEKFPMTQSSADTTLAAVQARDAFGNVDPRRTERESKRITSNDPLMFMHQAQRVLKQSERDKKAWEESRAASLEHHSRRYRWERQPLDRLDDIESFSLDAVPKEKEERKHRDHDGERRRHRHSHRHRSRSRSPHKHRNHSQRHGERRRE